MAYPIVGKHADLKKGAVIGLFTTIFYISLTTPNIFSNLGSLIMPSILGTVVGALIHKFVIR